MNATVMEHDIIKCDSPPAQGWFKSDTKEPRFYNVEITLDGTLFGGPSQRFNYYKEPEITSIFPSMGPIEGRLTSNGIPLFNIAEGLYGEFFTAWLNMFR